MSDPGKHEIDWVRDEDVAEIVGLFSLAFARAITPEYYRWGFFREERGQYSSLVLRVDGRIVSHTGYSPRRFRLNGSVGQAVIKGTSMTHPAFRGKGLYAKLLQFAHRRFAQEGTDFVLSWPNINNHPSQRNRSDYVDIYQIPTLQWCPKRSLASDITSPPYPQAKTVEFEDMEEIASLTAGKALFALERTPEYLRWRYAAHPDTTYYVIKSCVRGKPRAAALFKLYPPGKPSRINVVEWLCRPDDREAAEVLEMLEDYAESQGLAVTVWHNVHDYPRHHILERRGYRLAEPIFYFGVFQLSAPERTGEYRNWQHWYITMGDVDVF